MSTAPMGHPIQRRDNHWLGYYPYLPARPFSGASHDLNMARIAEQFACAPSWSPLFREPGL